MFDWKLYTGNLTWLPDRTIYITRHGSHAYGTSLPSSDLDLRGIVIPPKEYYLGFVNCFEQVVQTNPDLQIFEIKKFFRLACDANPNVLELLYTDESDHLLTSPYMEKLFQVRDKFLSKKVKHTFSGYAISQLKRINLHYRWLKNPPVSLPVRSDFGLPEKPLIPKDQLLTAEAMIKKQLDSWSWKDFEGIDDATRQLIKDQFYAKLLDITQWSWKDLDQELWLAAAKSQFNDLNLLEILRKEHLFNSKLKDWQHYQEWKLNRNPERAKLEEKYGYDCYVEETEFLTEDGWKNFDQISDNDKLATVYLGNATNRKHLGIEYQKFIDKFDGNFTGELYNLYGYHTDVLVTPNHKLLIQKEERASHKKYNYSLTEAGHLPDTFNILRQITPNYKNYSDKELNLSRFGIPAVALLRLMGWYLSDGTSLFRSTKERVKIQEIRISQIKNGKLYSSMKQFHNKYGKLISSSLYEYEKQPNNFNSKIHRETILSIRNKEIIEFIFKECSNVKNKRIPRWVFKLSKRQMNILLDALIKGDGTIRPSNSIIYYSSLKNLANDVQELAFMCGYETSLYGPYRRLKKYNEKTYASDMYQVHINKTREQNKLMIRCNNIKKIPFVNKRIVCFTVPNGTLITRLNGHIGIHGNSKHALHLVRLLKSCREILVEGKVKVRLPDAEELLAIRNGAWTYEEVVSWAEKQDQELTELMKISKLPNSVNRLELDQLCVEIIQQSL